MKDKQVTLSGGPADGQEYTVRQDCHGIGFESYVKGTPIVCCTDMYEEKTDPAIFVYQGTFGNHPEAA